MNETDIMRIYEGSNGEATKALYAKLEECGVAGELAMNLFRAQKSSARAKVYRGGVRGRGSFKGMAYNRKEWALGNACMALRNNAVELGIPWGWKRDHAQEWNPWVLYVDLPTGQVSFHSPMRLEGPDYLGDWDGIKDVSAPRIIRWVARVIEDARPRFPDQPIDGRTWHRHHKYEGMDHGCECADHPYGRDCRPHPHEGMGHLIDIGANAGIVYGPASEVA